MAEGKNIKKNNSIADEIFGRKDGSSSSTSGYFSNVFPSTTSSVMGNDTLNSEFFRTLNKQRTDSQAGNAQSIDAGSKSQGSPTIRQPTYNKDGKPVYHDEPVEATYFGSSVHYGGRDFYNSSLSMRATEAQKNYKNEGSDDHGNTNIATRGEWWQGSLYY